MKTISGSVRIARIGLRIALAIVSVREPSAYDQKPSISTLSNSQLITSSARTLIPSVIANQTTNP